MGEMFAPIGDFIKDNGAQVHQGMAIENIVFLMAYGFLLVTIIASVLLIQIARRIGLPKIEAEVDTSELSSLEDEPLEPAVSIEEEPLQ